MKDRFFWFFLLALSFPISTTVGVSKVPSSDLEKTTRSIIQGTSIRVPSPVSEVFSRWLEAVPRAPGGSRFLCSFLHLFRRSSQGGWRQLPGPKGVPGFSARSFTCFGGQYHRHCLFVAITRALHSSSSANSSHYGRSLFVSLRLRPFARWGCFCKAGLFQR